MKFSHFLPSLVPGLQTQVTMVMDSKPNILRTKLLPVVGALLTIFGAGHVQASETCALTERELAPIAAFFCRNVVNHELNTTLEQLTGQERRKLCVLDLLSGDADKDIFVEVQNPEVRANVARFEESVFNLARRSTQELAGMIRSIDCRLESNDEVIRTRQMLSQKLMLTGFYENDFSDNTNSMRRYHIWELVYQASNPIRREMNWDRNSGSVRRVPQPFVYERSKRNSRGHATTERDLIVGQTEIKILDGVPMPALPNIHPSTGARLFEMSSRGGSTYRQISRANVQFSQNDQVGRLALQINSCLADAGGRGLNKLVNAAGSCVIDQKYIPFFVASGGSLFGGSANEPYLVEAVRAITQIPSSILNHRAMNVILVDRAKLHAALTRLTPGQSVQQMTESLARGLLTNGAEQTEQIEMSHAQALFSALTYREMELSVNLGSSRWESDLVVLVASIRRTYNSQERTFEALRSLSAIIFSEQDNRDNRTELMTAAANMLESLAHDHSSTTIGVRIRELAREARSGRLTPQELSEKLSDLARMFRAQVTGQVSEATQNQGRCVLATVASDVERQGRRLARRGLAIPFSRVRGGPAEFLLAPSHVVVNEGQLNVSCGGQNVAFRTIYSNAEFDFAVLNISGAASRFAPVFSLDENLATSESAQGYRILYSSQGEEATPQAFNFDQFRTITNSLNTPMAGFNQFYRLSFGVRPGMSGGPILDPQNKFVGMIVKTKMNDAVSIAIRSSDLISAVSRILAGSRPRVPALSLGYRTVFENGRVDTIGSIQQNGQTIYTETCGSQNYEAAGVWEPVRRTDGGGSSGPASSARGHVVGLSGLAEGDSGVYQSRARCLRYGVRDTRGLVVIGAKYSLATSHQHQLFMDIESIETLLKLLRQKASGEVASLSFISENQMSEYNANLLTALFGATGTRWTSASQSQSASPRRHQATINLVQTNSPQERTSNIAESLGSARAQVRSETHQISFDGESAEIKIQVGACTFERRVSFQYGGAQITEPNGFTLDLGLSLSEKELNLVLTGLPSECGRQSGEVTRAERKWVFSGRN